MKIVCNNVSKSFKDVHALRNVNLVFEEKKIYGLLGRNGAGKTTLLNLISNRLFPTSGEILLDGVSVTENTQAQGKFFIMSESNYYPDVMKVKEVFYWTSKFYPNFDMDFALETSRLFGLEPNKHIKSLSTGYTSIYKIITAMASGADFIFLDEPVLGLDANHRDLFYRILIERYSENPATYVISTHLIEEVASVIEDVIIIKNGQIACNEPKDDFLQRAYCLSGKQDLVDGLAAGKKVLGVESLGGLKVAYILGIRPAVVPDGVEVTIPDIQRLFIMLTNTENEFSIGMKNGGQK